jgi:hypothetical protein
MLVSWLTGCRAVQFSGVLSSSTASPEEETCDDEGNDRNTAYDSANNGPDWS